MDIVAENRAFRVSNFSEKREKQKAIKKESFIALYKMSSFFSNLASSLVTPGSSLTGRDKIAFGK